MSRKIDLNKNNYLDLRITWCRSIPNELCCAQIESFIFVSAKPFCRRDLPDLAVFHAITQSRELLKENGGISTEKKNLKALKLESHTKEERRGETHKNHPLIVWTSSPLRAFIRFSILFLSWL